jgi:arylsulfatase A-like enzyme
MLWSLPFADQFFFVDPLRLELFPTRSFRDEHRRKQEGVQARARAMAADPALGLVFVHLPAPHGPGIYDRHTGKLGAPGNPKEWYLDNLALADRALGELRQALERSGLAARTAIIVTADHSWGASASFDGKRDPRIPLLVRLPGQTATLAHDSEVRTVLLQDLVLALLGDEVRTPEEVARWLESRGQRRRSGG